ncbi:MAG: serine/threonine-protein kinase [Acidobacteria bacterium]|nr:serine/threonine-protein kinase [Acidobacteriota bacterium]
MRVNSRYTILSKLRAGSMGEVYLARDATLVRTVALKILPLDRSADPKTIRRFKQEAKAASAFNHPNVVAIHEVGETEDGRPFIAMEHVEGQALDALLKGKPLAVEQVVNIGSQIADALTEAHARGIIHRDIKPANIMLTPRGQVKILDFGLAKLGTTSRGKPKAQLDTQLETTPSLPTGAVRFMSPEQVLGRPVDHRTDIFSLGVLLCEMITGRPPFSGSKAAENADQMIPTKPRALSNKLNRVPAELERIVTRCLEKNREQRYGSAKDLCRDLRQLKVASRSKAQRWIVGPLVMIVTLLLLFVSPLYKTVERLLGVPVKAEQERLVVLPFINIGGSPNRQPFGDGLIETVSSKLCQFGEFNGLLSVIPASDIRERRVSSANEAHRQFGATLAVTGSMQWQGDHLRLTLNLVDARTLRQLRSCVQDYPATTGSAFQDGIVLKLAQMLRLELQTSAQKAP